MHSAATARDGNVSTVLDVLAQVECWSHSGLRHGVWPGWKALFSSCLDPGCVCSCLVTLFSSCCPHSGFISFSRHWISCQDFSLSFVLYFVFHLWPLSNKADELSGYRSVGHGFLTPSQCAEKPNCEFAVDLHDLLQSEMRLGAEVLNGRCHSKNCCP